MKDNISNSFCQQRACGGKCLQRSPDQTSWANIATNLPARIYWASTEGNNNQSYGNAGTTTNKRARKCTTKRYPS